MERQTSTLKGTYVRYEYINVYMRTLLFTKFMRTIMIKNVKRLM